MRPEFLSETALKEKFKQDQLNDMLDELSNEILPTDDELHKMTFESAENGVVRREEGILPDAIRTFLSEKASITDLKEQMAIWNEELNAAKKTGGENPINIATAAIQYKYGRFLQ